MCGMEMGNFIFEGLIILLVLIVSLNFQFGPYSLKICNRVSRLNKNL